jgi:hypothetical protein
MNALLLRIFSADALPQRLAGAILVLIAFLLIVLGAAGLPLSPNACAILLFIVLAIIAMAIIKTPGGMTSLIGLLFLGTILWVAPRPFLALTTQDDSGYSLFFGQLVEPRGEDLYRLLAFWIIGIASLFGGYFLFFSDTGRSLTQLSDRVRIYCKRSFIVAFIIVAVLLPVLAHKRFVAFATGGYLALYLNQAESSFSLLPIIDYLSPTLFALAVLINEKRYSRLMLVAIVGYAFCGVLFGRRMEVGTWLLIALWHSSAIKGKPLRLGRLLASFFVAGYAFQWIEMLRTENDAVSSLFGMFFFSQGVIFMIPALSWQLSPPPVHTILGSFLSIRHFYRLLGIGSIGTANILDYISSQSSPSLFQSGNGLSSTGYLDIYFLCGQAMALYAAVCVLLGILLRKWEAQSSRSRVALFFLCVCLPSLLFVQRSSVFTVTSPIVYVSLFMSATYLLHQFLTLFEFNEIHAESFHGAN